MSLMISAGTGFLPAFYFLQARSEILEHLGVLETNFLNIVFAKVAFHV
jgi:hypothetical protein